MRGGTVREVSKGVFQARLPRSLSKAAALAGGFGPNYQQPLDETFATDEEARGYLDRIIDLKENGIELDRAGVITCRVAYERWLLHELVAKRKKYPTEAGAVGSMRTHYSCRKHLELAPFWDMPYRAVDAVSLVNFFKFMQREVLTEKETSLSASYINGCMTRVNKMFEWLEVVPNPARELKRLPKDKAPIDFLSMPELRDLFSNKRIPMKDRVMIGCLVGTGLRIGEFLSLEKYDLDLDSEDPYLDVKYGGRARAGLKHRAVGDNGRPVELHEPALSFFKIYMRDHYVDKPSKRIFTGKSDGYRKEWAEELGQLDDPKHWDGNPPLDFHVYPHKLRHTYAMSVINLKWGGGIPRIGFVRFVQKQLGHKTEDVTVNHYGKVIRQLEASASMRGEERKQKPPVTAYDLLGVLEVPRKVPRLQLIS